MMHLREDLTERFKQELDQLEESLQMPYVTSVERLAKAEGKAEGVAEGVAEGIAKGIAEGIAEGGAMVLLKPLAKLCGPLPEEIQQRIRHLPFEQLSALGEALLDFHSLADLQAWLDANECADR
jgi:flagellar biosynthesis/type III secretory pathway protein FliH